ncbi:MAG: M23 family metallopeptidase [Eubacteriales bacterium]|jgi:murein DD-endopeptidase MepM/ murein hydrolase activator NlpD|nr:M23 family metallopeptidase [Eubacteriales bacterium]
MFLTIRLGKIIGLVTLTAVAAAFLSSGIGFVLSDKYYETLPTDASEEVEKKYIKWVDLSVPLKVMDKTFELDVKSRQENFKLSWIELMAYLAAKYGGNFKYYKDEDLRKVVERLQGGEKMEDIAADLKYYPYYIEAYSAIFSEYVGPYKVLQEENGEKKWVDKYGLKVFSPLAKGYSFSHCDDFGNGRSFGYKRKHLGHDLMGSVGTPVIAIESGVVEVLGWNMYGGWRIGIRSFDKKRYYYYAHLRKDHPYHSDLAEGDIVTAGDVIGYLGMTGYSRKENVNNIKTPHLHFGIQLIFDESQKEGVNQIWIDAYNITKFLQKNRSAVVKQDKDFVRAVQIYDPSIPD